jgi:manganese-dependent inorganic pyrophosphatase
MISDTLNLTSPTTTDVDRDLMAELSRASGVDPASLAAEIFSVGSPLLTMSPDEAVMADSKEYEHGAHLYTVAQIEKLSFAPFKEKNGAHLHAVKFAPRRDTCSRRFSSRISTPRTRSSWFAAIHRFPA